MIWQMIEDWFRGILTDGILSNLSGLFDSVNTEVGEIATQVGTTPAGWNAGIFNMIRSLSENVIVPIAGVIITFVMCYELIQLVIEKNNLHDLDTWIFFKWIFKTFVAVLLVTNTWNIVMGVFDVTQSVVNQSAGVIISDTSIDVTTVITDIEAKLDAMSVGGLLGLWFQSLFVGLTMKALSICIMLVVYGRMIEIYLVTSVAPIPMATMVNHEWGSMGQNYLKSLLALGFQAFLILVCVGIYAVLIQTIAATDDISGAIWACMAIPSSCALRFSKREALQRASFRHIKGVSYDLKIGLIDVDSHNFPNLCLMKLSAYHKAKGHTVEWWNAKGRYDLVYKSRVFTDTYSKDTITVTNAEQVIFGGTGYDTKNRLPPEVEHSYPDYSIYPQFFGIAYGFLSRGCPRNCGFCIVSSKEGRKSVKVADLSEFWKWQPEIKIMDANLLACPDHENLIEQLIRSRAWVDFSQGLDIRLVNRDNVSLLNRVRIKAVHFAWDNPDEDLTGYFQRFLDLTAIKSSRQRRVYVLTNYGSTHEQDLYRVNTLRAMGFDPYVMIYERPTAPPVTRHLQRWVNNKRLFYAVPRFEDYIPGRKEV